MKYLFSSIDIQISVCLFIVSDVVIISAVNFAFLPYSILMIDIRSKLHMLRDV